MNHATAGGGPSRRQFLHVTGSSIAALLAGLTGGALGGLVHASTRPTPADLVQPTSPGFDHLVVLMFENRSFDSMLGRLYTPETLPAGQAFEGLAFGDYGNVAPDGTRIPASVYSGSAERVFRSPSPDPGEEYPHVNTQLFDVVDPPDNHSKEPLGMRAPYNAPRHGQRATMDGFVTDYASHVEQLTGKPATAEQLTTVMGGFSPEQLPVLSALAEGFAVYDHWFCAVPSQTFCNRSFFHASTSHGFVTNEGGGYSKWLDADAVATVFDRLEEVGKTWRVYYDAAQLVSMTGVIHAPSLERFWRTEHFATMEQFYEDVEHGRLPEYAFVEPRMVYDHNDMHPPVGVFEESADDGHEVTNGAVSDVRAGELLASEVYEAIRASASTSGSNALNTMLLITFDEHGGTYDHVPPPAATPPDARGPGEMDFAFDRLGCRVPAIAISAYTAAGTVRNEPMHHGSLAATLVEQHGIRPLTARDAGAPTLAGAINLTEARPPATWPSTFPQPVPSEAVPSDDPVGDARARPLSPPGRGLLGLLLARYAPDAAIPSTYGEAYDALQEHGRGLFGAH